MQPIPLLFLVAVTAVLWPGQPPFSFPQGSWEEVVWSDGDTVRTLQKEYGRLLYIDCLERGQHPTPGLTPSPVQLWRYGWGHYGRALVVLTTSAGEVNLQKVARGECLWSGRGPYRERRHQLLYQSSFERAILLRRGLWGGPPRLSPSAFRRRR